MYIKSSLAYNPRVDLVQDKLEAIWCEIFFYQKPNLLSLEVVIHSPHNMISSID